MKTSKNLSRRTFVKSSALASLGFSIVPRNVLGGSQFLAPSDTLTKAIIGVGGMGRGHTHYEGTKLLAICDVDTEHLALARQSIEHPVKVYSDFRELLENKEIDIVHIATPPHWHGIMAKSAAEAGKDIWCEKPMTRTIGEGKKVIEAVNAHGRMFRLNTWFRFTSQFYGFGTPVMPIKKVVESGILGWPLRVTVSGVTGFNWKFFWSGKKNLKPMTPPSNLDYNMWLGPAPERPYHPDRVHSVFRGYWDYDGGGLGDMGQHYLDPVQYILGKDDTSPISVEIDAPQQHHDAVGSWKRIELTYEDGCKIILDGENRDKEAPFIEGPDGKLYPGLQSDIPNLRNKIDQFPDPKPMVTLFSDSVRSREKFALNERNGHRSCTLVNLGITALRLGRSLKFDPIKQEFIDDVGANKLIDQPVRGPWSI